MTDPAADDDAPDAGGARRAARVVADADVLAADLLAGGDGDRPADSPDPGQSADSPTARVDSGNPARDAMDLVRSHSWLTLVASDPLLDDAAAVVADLADDALAADWRTTVASLATLVEVPAGDHPALAAALAGDAGHLLSYDEALTGPQAGVAVRQHVETSVRTPDAFLAVFDAAALYAAVEGGSYPGPDRDPRA